MLVRGAGSSGKRQAIPRPRPLTTPTSISAWWREVTAPDETAPVHSILEPGGIRARVNTGLRQSLATLAREEVLVAIPVDVSRADQPLELFRVQLLAGGLPLQLSDDLPHAAQSQNERARSVSLRASPGL